MLLELSFTNEKCGQEKYITLFLMMEKKSLFTLYINSIFLTSNVLFVNYIRQARQERGKLLM